LLNAVKELSAKVASVEARLPPDLEGAAVPRRAGET